MTRAILLAAGAGVLIAVPSTAGTFQTTLVTQGIVWAILGLSVWLLLRICDLPSFGHAAFFGVGAYVAGLAVVRWDISSVWVALVLAIAIACAVALPIALVAGRLSGIAFLLITLAFGEMLHALAGRWETLGGTDGLVGVIRPDAAPLPLELAEPSGFYYLALAMLGGTLLVLWTLVRSPVGGVLIGIRESEGRMAALGYNPVAYRVAAFVLSAGIAGAAGLLNAYLNRFVDPGDVSALVSARALLIVVIGGATLGGPVVAGLLLTELEDGLSSLTTHWLGILGLIYVLVALAAPRAGQAAALWARVRRVLHLDVGRPPRPAEEKP